MTAAHKQTGAGNAERSAPTTPPAGNRPTAERAATADRARPARALLRQLLQPPDSRASPPGGGPVGGHRENRRSCASSNERSPRWRRKLRTEPQLNRKIELRAQLLNDQAEPTLRTAEEDRGEADACTHPT